MARHRRDPERAARDAAAERAGRDPAAVRRLYNVKPDLGAEELARLATEHGTSTFILMSDDADELKRFATETAPRVRAMV